jgi:putative membrane protein
MGFRPVDNGGIPYCGSPPLPSELLLRWNFDPWLLAVLGLAVAAACKCEVRKATMLPGIAILAVLFVSPICALSSALFSSRVVHHVAMTSLAAPLLAASLRGRQGSLPLWSLLHALVFWAWHAPPLYAAALGDPASYWLMQLSMLGSAVGMWRCVMSAAYPAAAAALAFTMVHMGLLGAVLTFSSSPLYAWHLASASAWGLSALEDQQLAGLSMWVGGGAIYLAAVLTIMNRALGRSRCLVAA